MKGSPAEVPTRELAGLQTVSDGLVVGTCESAGEGTDSPPCCLHERADCIARVAGNMADCDGST